MMAVPAARGGAMAAPGGAATPAPLVDDAPSEAAF
ncbi:hypothetical protein HaLaN_24371 [Haematococcus lacustris]|uniref:Uncharacterized protein n=1 Tax=Haematococcus lacustris TaxID=44745 RepID=A0A699ZU79_HAELA|nr:hypothetical protein HaLaN_24371 [Haematococcus lacustris]